ncbi:hypothetical protein EVAR_53058_1 [Eumeta japonica]|uniref:Uncharacterized protein n=1 Tax=Eumeta variegata TaxID=151549 RepID=A0A4C1YW88_EUMVA|nr:hypothetical protein EVAR_53058_1 [Eumeta japonica]
MSAPAPAPWRPRDPLLSGHCGRPADGYAAVSVLWLCDGSQGAFVCSDGSKDEIQSTKNDQIRRKTRDPYKSLRRRRCGRDGGRRRQLHKPAEAFLRLPIDFSLNILDTHSLSEFKGV